MIVTAENALEEVTGERIWPKNDYFKSQVTDYYMKKVKYLENSIFYVSQVFLTIQKGEKMFCGAHFILGQIIEAANVPVYIDNYKCWPEEVKTYQLQYCLSTGKFQKLYKTIGLIIIRGDDDEMFSNYGYEKQKSKLLYSVQRRCISNSFSRTLFNKHREAIACGEMKDKFSKLFFFLSSVTDRSEEVNQYLNNVIIRPVDIVQSDFKQWTESGEDFESHYLELFGEKRRIARIF